MEPIESIAWLVNDRHPVSSMASYNKENIQTEEYGSSSMLTSSAFHKRINMLKKRYANRQLTIVGSAEALFYMF